MTPSSTPANPGAPPLLVVAHGSRDPRAAAAVEALVGEVRRRRRAPRVVTAYLDHAPPTAGQALDALAGRARGGNGEVIVLPLLLTAAYHSKTDLPGALREARRRHPLLRLYYGETLGPHEGLIAALERRLAEVGVTPGDPETAVVLAAAGSSDPSAGAVVAGMAREWARRGWWAVTPAYASAVRPRPEEAVTRLLAAGAPRVAVATYILAPGYFADKVRRDTLAAGAVAVSPVLGPAPEVADIVAERYVQAMQPPQEVAAAG
ncbi:MAG: sirohydrochlorin chelatase [Streptosporangiales bacterium]|nr:sirohydrochlorin chelatase [Streptosporangiales bacterium]